MIKLGHVRYLEEPTVYAKSGCNVRLKIRRHESSDLRFLTSE
jgi:hypothetical protein